MSEKRLSIIIPIYNEEKIVAAYLPLIFTLPIPKEIIIVNDGSTDDSSLILEKLKQNYDFTLINQTSNQGKGAAVKRGLKEISGDYFIICDADAEYDPNDIIYLFTEIQKIPDVKTALYGSRFLRSPRLTWHYLINSFLTKLTNWLFHGRLTDMETCFKLIPAAALVNINLRGGRFEIEPEITAQLLKNGYQISERPINYKRRGYKEGKKIKARDGLLAIKTLLHEKIT